jgi:hypothetical protein
MIAAGKKNRLKMKYPMKLWPLRPATRAGQNGRRLPADEQGHAEGCQRLAAQVAEWLGQGG